MTSFDSVKVYAKFDGATWTDITSDVIRVPSIDAGYGITGTGVNDRSPTTGEMALILDNSANNSGGTVGYYSPNSTACRTGFTTGLEVKLEFSYDSKTKTKFIGRISPEGIVVAPWNLGERKTYVTVLDWVEQTAIHNIDLPEYATDKTFSELAALVIANMPFPPEGTEYGSCESTFPYVFDTTGDNTKAMTELNKGALSEFSYWYVKGDGTFVTEGRETRNERAATSQIDNPAVDAGYLQMHDGSYLLTHDYSKIILSEKIDIDLTNDIKTVEVANGENLATIVSATGYPRQIDAAATTILFSLPKATRLDAGQTLSSYRGRYTDPTGVYKSVAGINMGTAVYQAFQNEDGTGTDYSASVAVTPTYGTNGVSYEIVNNAGTIVWLTQLQAVGRGVYWDNPFSYMAFDSAAKAAYGSYQTSIEMKYQDDPTVVQNIVDIMLSRLKTPKTFVKSVTCIANRNKYTMGAFFDLDIGDRVRIVEPVNSIDGEYFIQGISYKVYPGDIVEYTWITKPTDYDSYVAATWDVSLWDGVQTWGA